MSALKVGDPVRYYCNSQMRMRDGVITAVDVAVEHLWEWADHGTVFQSPHPNAGATHPLGVEINGSLTRSYIGNGSGDVGGYDKSMVAA